MGRVVTKPSPVLRLLLEHKRHWPGLIAMVLLALLAGVFKTRAAALWGQAADYGIAGDISAMRGAALGMLLFIALDGLRTGVHYTVIGLATEGLFYRLRLRLFDALSRADTAALEKDARSGDMALRACEDTERLCDFIAGNLSHYARLIFQAVFAVVSCVMISWQLAAAYFLLLPVALRLLAAAGKTLEKLQAEARGGAGRSADVVSGALSGIQVVKTYALEDEMSARFAAHTDGAYARLARSLRIGMGMTAVKYTAAVLQSLVLLAAGAWLVGRGAISVGQVMAFVVLAAYVTEAFDVADRMIFQSKNAAALCARVYEMLDLPPEPSPAAAPKATEVYARFDRVDFAYDKNGSSPALSGLNLVIKKGCKVAVVGPSGSGKSTVVKLICRLYGCDGGRLTLFGQDGDEIDTAALRGKLALVSQEPGLFEGSIADNVRYGRPSATDADVIKALQAADLWGFVSALPGGMHTALSEYGANLSGGQRQRLAIARALIKDAELVLLDEATSALDAQSEREIQHALDNLLAGRAALIVAHRLTTVQNADYIYCLDNGRVVEEGSPAELFAAGGYYAAMCKMQGVA